jgi:hypothetical protein
MKIFQKDVVKMAIGTCDFCGKQGSHIAGTCFLPIAECVGTGLVVYEHGYTWFTQKMIAIKYHWESIYKSKTIDVQPLICLNCVKEFSKIK